MSQQYLLPCPCGKTTPVTPTQAGRVIVCECGSELKVPTLAGLRKLDMVEEPTVGKRPPPAWSALRGTLFVVGVLLTIVGLAVGGFACYVMRSISLADLPTRFKQIETADVEWIDRMTPEETYELWKDIRSYGLGAAGSAPPVKAQEAFEFWTATAIAAFAVAAVGILMAGGSMVGVGPQR